MILTIRHETRYAYSTPLAYTIQQLHLTPRIEPQQRALSWQIATPGQCHAYTDAYGNLSQMLTMNGKHSALSLVAQGVVETIYPYQGRLNLEDTLSPLLFTMPTRLTESGPTIVELAGANLPERGTAPGTRHLLRLAESIAHLYLACCHAWGIPARYVSGYIDPGSTGHAATHAWVDAWAVDSDYAGWVSIDVTHARLMTDAYCRLAIGRDYDSAAPVRGVRRGGGKETLSVEVQIVAS